LLPQYGISTKPAAVISINDWLESLSLYVVFPAASWCSTSLMTWPAEKLESRIRSAAVKQILTLDLFSE